MNEPFVQSYEPFKESEERKAALAAIFQKDPELGKVHQRLCEAIDALGTWLARRSEVPRDDVRDFVE